MTLPTPSARRTLPPATAASALLLAVAMDKRLTCVE